MKTHIISIGNSRGIRIPKALLEESQLSDEVELDIFENEIRVRSVKKPRQGWTEMFALMAKQGHDKLLDQSPLIPNEWDDSEWEW